MTRVHVSDARIPSLFSFLPTRMPGLSSSTMKAEMPRFPLARSVTAIRMATAPTDAFVMKFFEPFSTHWLPSRTAVVFVPARIRSGLGLRQAPGREPLSRRQLRHVLPPLGLGAELVEVVRAEAVVGRERKGDRRIHARDLFDDRGVVHVGQSPAPPYSSGKRTPRKPSSPSLRKTSPGNSWASSQRMTWGRISASQKSRSVWMIRARGLLVRRWRCARGDFISSTGPGTRSQCSRPRCRCRCSNA